jgi:putative Holliday junction resolvase
MRVLGIDLGSTRIGGAVGDTATGVATPAEVVTRLGNDRSADRRALRERVDEWEAELVVVGLPLSLDGTDGPAAIAARQEADALAEVLGVPVELHDERLSTVTAHHALREAGVAGRKRRGVVDAMAASVILQSWLDTRSGDAR